MPFSISHHLDVGTTAGQIPGNHPDLVNLTTLLHNLNAVVPLTSFRFEVDPTPPVDAPAGTPYEYVFTGQDGRVWRQWIVFASPTDSNPLMNFRGGYWRQTEFVVHRDLRDHVIRMRRLRGVTSIVSTWEVVET